MTDDGDSSAAYPGRAAATVVAALFAGGALSFWYYPALAAQLSPKEVFESYEKLRREGREPDEKMREEMGRVRADYEQQLDAKYAAARGFVDAVLAPEETRDALELALRLSLNYSGPHLGQFVLPPTLT